MARPSKEESKKSALFAGFGERYDIHPWDGGFLLYDKETRGKRANHKFCGRFYISSNTDRFVFNDNYYNTVEELMAAMEAYYSSLPFDAEIYNPVNRKSYVIECATHDYLTSLGFKKGKWSQRKGEIYHLKDVYGQTVCTLAVEVEFDTMNGKVKRAIEQDRWQEASFNDLDSAIGAVNSLLVGYLGIVQAQLMNCLKSLTTSRAAIVLNQTFDINTFTLYTEDARQKTIEYLEAELKRLKGE